MSDIIELLPDSIANQIAAGEVVQRPASVVKELMENSIDAGSTSVQVVIRDGGKGLIQIIDNGCGMSETDARLSFERHATSKIRRADDLFAIQTMGFRGEALASIAAVAEVEMKTRTCDNQVGTSLTISGSDVVEHEPTACSQGTSIAVKNLFFNIPARRKFLKSTSVELKHIINEFQRVALANPSVAFSLSHNGADIYKLSEGNIKQRIVSLMGKNLNNQLVNIDTLTSVVEITGFIGTPESAKKSSGEQFFFVNNRYIRSPYLHRAVMKAYENLIPTDSTPPYFIFFTADPASIDVNIHPTKTDIKFEDERLIWQILHAAVKETLGKFAVVPSINFDVEPGVEIPFLPKDSPVFLPEIEIDTAYNPFNDDAKPSPYQQPKGFRKHVPQDWQDLYRNIQGEGFVQHEDAQLQTKLSYEEDNSVVPTSSRRFFQLKNKYIITSVKSGMMIIDQKRAHERILFENYITTLSMGPTGSQHELFPQSIELSPGDYILLTEQMEGLTALGVSISLLGQNTIAVNALPSGIKEHNPHQLIEDFITSLKDSGENPAWDAHEKLSASLAKASAIPYNISLEPIEMQNLVDKLFACKNPNVSPHGKPIITILEMDEIEKRLK